MKTKDIIIIVIICLVITIGIIIIPNINKKEDLSKYEITDANITCYYKSEANTDDTYIANIHNYMYLYEDNKTLSKVIYKRIYDKSYYNESLSYLLRELNNIYDRIDGVKITEDRVNKKVILTIEYDYKVLDLDYIHNNYKDIFNPEFPLMKANKDIRVEEYISLEDPNYNCK